MTQYKCSQCGRSATQQCKREDNYSPLYGKSEYRPFCNTCITIKASKYPLSYRRLGEKTTPLAEEKEGVMWSLNREFLISEEDLKELQKPGKIIRMAPLERIELGRLGEDIAKIVYGRK